MTNKPRRPRSDSTDNLHRILAGANIEIAPPAHVPLTEADWPYWHSILDEFALSDWTRHALEIAAFLARTMAHLEGEQRQLFQEGVIQEQCDGSLRTNPRANAVNRLHSQALAIRRSLGLTGRAKAGSSRDAASQREANRRTERSAVGGDDLLA